MFDIKTKIDERVSQTLRSVAISIIVIGLIISLKTGAAALSGFGGYYDEVEEILYFLEVFFSQFIIYFGFAFVIHGIASLCDILLAIYFRYCEMTDIASHNESDDANNYS